MAQIPKLSSQSKAKSAKRPPATSKTPTSKAKHTTQAYDHPEITPELRHQMIEEAAYLRAERRGFVGGDPVNDWLVAEQEINRRLAASAASIAK